MSLREDDYHYDIDDPAYLLSSGETGDIVNREPISLLISGDESVETTLCSCTRCPHCKTLIYDEDIMCGWLADESNLNSICPFCAQQLVPILTVRIVRYRGTFPSNLIEETWYGQKYMQSSSNANSPRRCRFDRQQQTKSSKQPTVDNVRDTSFTVPFISPLVLRRELENVLSTNEMALSTPNFVETNEILYWNLIYYFQRLSVPSHLSEWIRQIDFWTKRNSDTESRPMLVDAQLLIRCIYDLPALHDDECNKPLYSLDVDDTMNALCADDNEQSLIDEHRSVLLQVLDALTSSNMHKPIQLLINEHQRKRIDDESMTMQLPKHCSIYRDIQFAALFWFGVHVKRDELEQSYHDAFQRLPSNIVALLSTNDYPPKLSARACRKIFMPLDVC